MILRPCVQLAAPHNWNAGMYLGFGMQHRHSAACLHTGAPPNASTLTAAAPAYTHRVTAHNNTQTADCHTRWEGTPEKKCGLCVPILHYLLFLTSWHNDKEFHRMANSAQCMHLHPKSIQRISRHGTHPPEQLGDNWALTLRSFPLSSSHWLKETNPSISYKPLTCVKNN